MSERPIEATLTDIATMARYVEVPDDKVTRLVELARFMRTLPKRREAAGSAGAETEPQDCIGTHDPFTTCPRCDDGKPEPLTDREYAMVTTLLKWRNASLEGDASDLFDLTDETTDLLDAVAQGEPPQALDVRPWTVLYDDYDKGTAFITDDPVEEQTAIASGLPYDVARNLADTHNATLARLSKPCPRPRHDEHCADLHWEAG